MDILRIFVKISKVLVKIWKVILKISNILVVLKCFCKNLKFFANISKVFIKISEILANMSKVLVKISEVLSKYVLGFVQNLDIFGQHLKRLVKIKALVKICMAFVKFLKISGKSKRFGQNLEGFCELKSRTFRSKA